MRLRIVRRPAQAIEYARSFDYDPILLLQHVLVQAQVGDHAPELLVLFFQSSELLKTAGNQAIMLALPALKGLLRYVHPSDHLGDRRACLRLH
jgi:hypothetical protein